MYRVFEALDELSAIVEEARGVPMTAGCVVPRGDVLELVDDIKDAIPGELDDAQDVLDARDAMLPTGGTVEICSWRIPEDHTLAGSNGNGAHQEAYAFSVRDTGSGIAPELLNRIFDPFFTTKHSGKGTGLGLFIARRIVQQHNGRIWAENNELGGATFTVVLPRKL